MRKILVSFFFFSTSVSVAQSFHAGVFGGLTNYHGDVVDKGFGRFTKPAIGINGNYEISGRVSLRAGLTLGKIAGDDKYNAESVRIRNLNFESRITEFSLLGEFHVFNLENIRWTPYAFAGLALYHFNPYTSDSGGVKTFLKPLSTEGQGIAGYNTKEYSLTQLALPFGGGIKYSITDNFRIGLEVGMRKLFTDYLDDVSTNYADPADLFAQRGAKSVDLSYRSDELPDGNPTYPQKGAQRGGSKQKDWYYFTGLHLTFRLNGDGGGGRNGKKGYGCPASPL
jgi:opacity protein-like surface antigen